MNEKIYPSDLTDEEWEWIKDLIPAAKSGGRPRTLRMRAVLNAIFEVTKWTSWVKEQYKRVLESVARAEGQKGFAVFPHRWVVESTLAW